MQTCICNIEPLLHTKTITNKKAQLSLTNPRKAKACQKLLQFDVLTTLSLTILVYLHSFSCCCSQNLRNPKKLSENSKLQSSGHPRPSIQVSLERAYATSYESQIVTLDVSPTVFQILTFIKHGLMYSIKDIDTFSYKIACFPPAHHCLTPPRGGTPCTINIIYTSLKSTFSGLQFCLITGLSYSFSHCCLPKSRNQAKF